MWGGRVFDPLMEFIGRHEQDTDILCFQEVYNNASESLREVPEEHLNIFSEIESLLPNHQGYFFAQVEGTGVATFIRKSIEVGKVSTSTILTAEELAHFKMPTGDDYYPRPLLRVDLRATQVAVCNVHGVPGSEKRDTPERELQTSRILEILNVDNVSKVLVGDFNLSPDTNAIETLESIMQNPLKKSGFNTTRSNLYNKKETLPFADYAFVSPSLAIKHFEVLQDEVSDHLPLMLEF